MRIVAFLSASLTAVCLLPANISAADAPQPDAKPDPAQIEFFEKKIRPLLAEHCLKCHGEKEPEAGLRLDIKAGWAKGGESGPAIRPGKPQESLLIKMVHGRPAKMPPESVLPQPLIDDLIKWVEMGAPDPRDGQLVTVAKTIDWEAGKKFWAFQPIVAAEPPKNVDATYTQPIDRFVAAAWQKAGVKPTGRADKATLLRRLSFTLTGLPPTLAEVQAFEADKSPDALGKQIDQLLASPRYGEHQARQWLDVVRYGEDRFSQDDNKQANPWRYRDWVIQALNDDLPYHQFLTYQLAADLIEKPGDHPQHRAALGFIALGPTWGFVNDNDRSSAEEWSDRIDVLTRGFLGLTVSCARCHDHKYDPIGVEDYYALAGVMAGSKTAIVPVAAQDEIARYDAAKKVQTEVEEKAKSFLRAETDRRSLEAADKLVDLTLQVWAWSAKRHDQGDLKAEDFAKGVGADPIALTGVDNYLKKSDRGPGHYLAKWPELLPKKDGPREPPAEIRTFAEMFRDKVKENLARPPKDRNLDQINDLFGEKGPFPLIEANVLKVAADGWKAEYEKLQAANKDLVAKLPPEPAKSISLQDNNPRDIQIQLRGNPYKKGDKAPRRFLRVLSADEPAKLTDGSGRKNLADAIVDPKNPLTARVLVNRIWQQHFGQGIVATSSNFGLQGSRPTHPELLDYLATQFVKNGWSIKRLHREILLTEAFQRASTGDAASLKVDPENRWLWRYSPRRHTIEQFRDSVLVAAGTLNLEMGGPSDNLDEDKTTRRTLYGKVSRKELSKLLQLFDFADPNITNDRRNESTLPQQMLFLMNSPFVVENAKKLAARVQGEPTAEAQVRRAYELALSRLPSEKELAVIGAFLAAEDAADEQGKNTLTRLERFVQSLLVSNEFYFVN